MKKSQILSLWIFAILWAITLGVWYTTTEYVWGFTQFLQATLFWSIFAILSHLSLGNIETNKETPLHTNVEYFSVSTKKLAIFSICTMGIYSFYWFYRNWKAVKVQGGEEIHHLLRAWFSLFTCYGLFRRIFLSATNNGFVIKHSAKKLAFAYIIISINYNSPWPFMLVSLFHFVPLLGIQEAINFHNQKINPAYVANNTFNWKEITACVVGGLLLTLMLVALSLGLAK